MSYKFYIIYNILEFLPESVLFEGAGRGIPRPNEFMWFGDEPGKPGGGKRLRWPKLATVIVPWPEFCWIKSCGNRDNKECDCCKACKLCNCCACCWRCAKCATWY